MTHRITASELAARLPDILDTVRQNGDRYVVERDGEPVATIAPPNGARDGASDGVTWGEFVTTLAALPRPDAAFADDLEAIHVALNQAPFEPPAWP